MTTDHEHDQDPMDLQARAFDEQVAARLRRASAELDLPTTTAAQAEAGGRRRQRRTRLVAGTGVVATVVAAVAAVLAIQPLGSADVVDAATPTTATCATSSPSESPSGGLGSESRLESDGISGWALGFSETQALPTDEATKVVWRLSGTGEPDPVAIAPSGARVAPLSLQGPRGSNWDRPGDEFETIYVFDEPGCWRLHMTRDQGSASLAVEVADAAVDAAGDPLEGVDLSDVSSAQAAEISDRVVTSNEYLSAFHRYRECLSAAGFELSYQELDHLTHTPDVPPVSYGVPPAAVEDGADRECYDAEFHYVDILWQTADDVQDGSTGPPQGAARPEAEPASIDLDCSTAIGSVAAPEEPFGQVLDAVALPIATSAPDALQARREDVDSDRPWFAKTGLLVRADTDVTITVDDPATTAIRWGNGARDSFGPSLATHGCRGDGWLAFPGGFRVDEPRCVTLHVATSRGDQAVQVGVGAPCPGQGA